MLMVLAKVVSIRATCFNLHELCILPTECIYGFEVILRINSDYYLKQL
jgi:hypothetical protein